MKSFPRLGFRLALLATVLFSIMGEAAHAQVYQYFGPANGILKGSTSTPITTAAVTSDVLGLWSGSCGPTTYLSGSGVCSTPSGTGGGTVNSVALTMPSGFTVAGSPITNTGTLAVTTTLNGVLKGTGSAFTTAAAADVVGLFSTCSGVQYLGADGACHSATVTSVALADGSTAPIFTITGSPVTGSGTLTETLSTQTTNKVLAAPNGSTGQPTFRALAGADLPAINLAGGSGVVAGLLPFANMSLTSTNVTSLWTGTCSASTFLRGDGACISPGGAGTVTSVGVSAPSVFAVGGTNPVTSSGTIALTFATGQTANQILASPNGTTGAVSLRSMVAGDLPGSITSNTSGNAATATALASSPTQCSGSTSFAQGIAASGNANCATLPAYPVGANPSATVGPSVTNGSATTFMRSDAAPAINQGANYTWSGTDFFSGTPVSANGTTGFSAGAQGGAGIAYWFDSSAATNNGIWRQYVGTSVINFGALNDAGTAEHIWLSASRSGTTISTITIGNTSDAPAIALDGPVSIPAPSSAVALSVNSAPATAGVEIFGAASNSAVIEYVDGRTGNRSWFAGAGLVNTGDWDIYDATLNAPKIQVEGGSTGGVIVGAATGGNQGGGTLNAQGLFVNGVAVTAGIGQTTGSWSVSYVSGCNTGTTAASGNYIIQGSLVFLNVTAVTACGVGGGNLVYTALPSALFPTHTQISPVAISGGGSSGFSAVSISVSGVMTIGIASITASGFFTGATFTYTLN